MDDYNFWRDFFDTYQSLSDWMKFAWLVVPPVFFLGLVALALWYRVSVRRTNRPSDHGELAYTVLRDADDRLHIYRHPGAGDGDDVALLPVDPAMGGRSRPRLEAPDGGSYGEENNTSAGRRKLKDDLAR